MTVFSLYFFFGGIASAVMVLLVSNPVYAVFFLILVFFMSACFLLVITVDFIAIVFVVVYVGAVAVLFLFVVMMLHIKLVFLLENVFSYIPIILCLFGIFVGELCYFLWGLDFEPSTEKFPWIGYLYMNDSIILLASVLYTHYFVAFFVAGLLLLVAMLGSICLTLHQRWNVRRQQVFEQVGRMVVDTVVLRE